MYLIYDALSQQSIEKTICPAEAFSLLYIMGKKEEKKPASETKKTDSARKKPVAESAGNEEKKTPPAQTAESHESADLYENRLEKLSSMLERGENPYAISFRRLHSAGELLAIPESEHPGKEPYRPAGRIRSRRMMGKAGFMDLEDETGRIQLYGSQEELVGSYEVFKHLDLGDIVGVEGFLFKTKTGQISLRLKSIKLLAKCLRPLPVVKEADGKIFDAFTDKEQRYRMRYVDFIVNPQVKQVFQTRSRIISAIRAFLEERGFMEVETPMMHTIPGGATAKPFTTHHNTLGMDLYLRIAPELYLKRLIVGGFPKVYEMNRNFRNEGISYKHNPEFTMLELYEAYGDMHSVMKLCEDLIVKLTNLIHGTTKINCDNHKIDLTPPWPRMKYLESVEKFGGVKITDDMTLPQAKKAAQDAGIAASLLESCDSIWRVAEVVFDEKVEAKLIQPVFITHFPLALSPLAKAWPENKNYVERFEPYIAGREIGNAFSELNDPIDQKKRFEDQVRVRESGAGEGGYMDHDYVRALEYGMPPTGGLGIGIDRLVMLLTDTHSIRDTILFPLMRPE